MKNYLRRPRLVDFAAVLTLVGTLPAGLYLINTTPQAERVCPTARAEPPASGGDDGPGPLEAPETPDPRLDRIRTCLLGQQYAAAVSLGREARAHPANRNCQVNYRCACTFYNRLAQELTAPALAASHLPHGITPPDLPCRRRQ